LRRINEITGVFVLIIIGVLIGAVLWMGHSQHWFRSRVALRITLPEAGAAGIRQGSEVYFLGTLVGSVSDVTVYPTGRMEAEASIRRDFFRFVRADSSAVVKKKFGVAGDSFFKITRGTGQPLPEAPGQSNNGRCTVIILPFSLIVPISRPAGGQHVVHFFVNLLQHICGSLATR
jgi:phospholipid/cholesterol/gamma-HCH transport system substrate-binding protein